MWGFVAKREKEASQMAGSADPSSSSGNTKMYAFEIEGGRIKDC